MKCPDCGSDSRVSNSRMVRGKNVIKRMRDCKNCDYQWPTYEIDIVEFDLLEELRVLSNGSTELNQLITRLEIVIGKMENPMVYNEREGKVNGILDRVQ